MSRIKNLFFRYSTPFVRPFSLNGLKNMSRVKFILPLYHLISDSPPAHVRYLFPVRNVKAFVKDIDFLAGKFKPVPLDDLIQYVRNGEKPGRPVFHLTFDDGLREFHDVVAPILKEKGIPATCFLNTAFIDNKSLFFRFKASLLIDRLRSRKAGTEEWCMFHQWELANDLHGKYYRKVILDIDYNRQDLLDELATAIRFSFPEYLSNEQPYLTIGQIKSLIDQGFTFGAHSIDHPEYYMLSEEDQITQTIRSIESVTGSFNLPYKAFAFPFTDHEIAGTFFKKIFDQEIADITFGTAGLKKDSFERNLQRIPVENFSGTLQEVIKNEMAYSLFLKLFGRYKIDRNRN